MLVYLVPLNTNRKGAMLDLLKVRSVFPLRKMLRKDFTYKSMWKVGIGNRGRKGPTPVKIRGTEIISLESLVKYQ